MVGRSSRSRSSATSPSLARRLEAAETGRRGRGADRRCGASLGTFRELRGHKDAGLLLLAFLVYNDAVNTIIRMAMIYGDEIGISSAHLMLALLMIQLVGVPFAFAFGALADRVGTKRAIFVTLAVYSGVSVYGFALGRRRSSSCSASWSPRCRAASRRCPARSSRPSSRSHKAGEMFGFFGVFDRFGGAIGTFVFGVMLATTGSSRPAILTLIVFFAIGALLLSRVDVERGRRLAREAEAAAHEVRGVALSRHRPSRGRVVESAEARRRASEP